mgnify:CR=1 FL=1
MCNTNNIIICDPYKPNINPSTRKFVIINFENINAKIAEATNDIKIGIVLDKVRNL